METESAKLLAVEIGGTKLQVCAGTADGKILERRRFAIVAADGAEGIQKRLRGVLPELAAKYSPRAVGVGYGGPVDWRTGAVIHSHQIKGWDGFPLGVWLSELCGCRVVIDNDANVAALGEAKFGAGRGREVVFYATIGSGVGGGVTVGGKVYHGAQPGEVEIGHLRLDKTGRTVEDVCSGWNVDRRIRAETDRMPSSMLASLVKRNPGREARHLAAALAAEDELARRILAEWASDFAFALAHITHLFHPEVIVLGGGLSLVGESLRAAVAAELPKYLMQVFRPGPAVKIAELGEDVVPIGALALSALE